MLPAMGFTSDILATFCRRPIFGYRSMVYAIMAIGTLSFLVWGHHMFVSGMSPFLGSLFVVTTLAIAIPSAVKAFNWLFTIARARIQFTSASLFGLGVVSLFVTGGLTGIFLGTNATDIQLHDTYFVVGHFHFIMAGAGLFGAFGAVYYWYPKMFGRMLSERLGKIHFWITFVAYYAVFFPMHYLGVSGMMRRIYDPERLRVPAAPTAGEPLHHDLRVRALRRAAGLHLQLLRQHAARRAGDREPVELRRPRVVRSGPSRARQLGRRDSAGPPLALRLFRTRQEARLHAAVGGLIPVR